MKTFKVSTTIRDNGFKYNSPSFYVYAETQIEAIKKSGLSRFDNCSFNAIELSKIKKTQYSTTKRPKADPKSKSQLGKKIHGHENSRPVRRGLRRLSIASGSTEKGCKKAGAIKMW